MASEPLKLSELENQLAFANHEHPGLDKLEALNARIKTGAEKIAAAKAAGNNGRELRAAESKLEALQEELRKGLRAEAHWYVLDTVHNIWKDFRDRGFVTVSQGARLAVIVPGMVEVKVRLDGIDDVPF